MKHRVGPLHVKTDPRSAQSNRRAIQTRVACHGPYSFELVWLQGNVWRRRGLAHDASMEAVEFMHMRSVTRRSVLSSLSAYG